MLDRLLAYVASASDEALAALTLQDMALCQAWYESYFDDPKEQRQYEFVLEKVAAWQSMVQTPAEHTAGRRHQVFLRQLIEHFIQKRQKEFGPDEIAFLTAVHYIGKGIKDVEQYDRVHEMLDPYMPVVLSRRQEEEPVPRLRSIAKKLQYATEEDIRKAPMRETRLLAGIELPCRGPVLTCRRHLRILGDVPDTCTVVVEGEGNICCVDGYVLGRVLAKQQCEVRGNVSGVIVTLHGDIRARSVINNAQTIAKMGGVYCLSAQGPKLIFAGRRIEIATGTMLGNFITRVMNVAEDVKGGRIQVAELAQARYFRHLGSSQLGIVLRRELSCEDFGEITGAELNRLLSQAYQLRRAARNFDTMAQLARREIEHKAQSALMFLLGGGETHKKLQEIMAAQRRINMLVRIISNLQDVLERVQDGMLGALDEFEAENAEFADISAFLEEEETTSLDQDLLQETEEARALQERLAGQRLDRTQTQSILSEVTEKIGYLENERSKLAAVVSQREKEMQSLDQYETLLAGVGKNASKLEMLQKLLPAVRRQGPDSPIAARLQAGLVVMALRTIERQSVNLEEYERHAVENRRNFQAVSDRLGKDFQIRILENPEDEAFAARVMGRFESGVKIYMDVYVENEAEAPKDSIVTTPDSDDVRTYVRAGTGARFHSRE